jgi:predicted NAD/FAD-dependent oxidoreductase
MPESESAKIAVIGAGFSGLACARELAAADVAVEVFEKARGGGGRAATRRAGAYRFDHGAQYFTVRDARFGAEVDRWLRAGIVQPWSGRVVELGEGGSTIDKGEPTRYVGVPGMTAPARALAGGLNVLWRARVKRIDRSGSNWRLVLESGHAYDGFAGVVVSAPAPQSAELLRDAAPQLAAACRAVVMQPCWSVMAAFAEPIGAEFDGAFINGRDLAWAARNSGKPGRPTEPECWVLHAGPDWSRRNLERERSEVARELLTSLFELGGRPYQEALHLDAHRWRFARSARPATAGCLFDPDARVAVCGDWLNGDRVEGAFTSGLRAAEAFISGDLA